MLNFKEFLENVGTPNAFLKMIVPKTPTLPNADKAPLEKERYDLKRHKRLIRLTKGEII